ncbi:MAG: hypothetical protein JNL94_02750 [Planctomycetes bacterium]|nr:hypothetical protein [Planctomycetota bacterium]
MSFFSGLDSLRRSLRTGLIARVLSVLLGGSLNQKVIVVLGLTVVVGSVLWLVSQLWEPLLLTFVGVVIVSLAVKDFERTSGPSP